METIRTFFGKTNYWWAILLIGTLIALAGFWMLFYPLEGYLIIARLFGWSLLIAGVAEFVIATRMDKKLHGWGWWLAGGIIDLIIGLILIANINLSMAVLPYFFAFIFLFKGIQNIIAAFMLVKGMRYWWLYLINGVLMVILSWMFFSSGYDQAFMVDFLVSIVFIYWGITMAIFSFDLKPNKNLKE